MCLDINSEGRFDLNSKFLINYESFEVFLAFRLMDKNFENSWHDEYKMSSFFYSFLKFFFQFSIELLKLTGQLRRCVGSKSLEEETGLQIFQVVPRQRLSRALHPR